MQNDQELLSEIVSLAKDLISIPSVTVGISPKLDEVWKAYEFIKNYSLQHLLEIHCFETEKYPALLVGFPGKSLAPVMLSAHFDVVAPEPDESQFIPEHSGEYLCGRGAADMKTVLATYMVWMKRTRLRNSDFPNICLLLVGNEETGEFEPMGTRHVLDKLSDDFNYSPELMIVGERTEETGSSLWGEVCTQNRGLVRFQVSLSGVKSHSGIASIKTDLSLKLLEAQEYLYKLAGKHLTLSKSEGWYSQIRIPFVSVGSPGIYNITPDFGSFGVEIRVIPQDDVEILYNQFSGYCKTELLSITNLMLEPGIECNIDNPYLSLLTKSFEQVSGFAPTLGQKMAGTSARFAPGGKSVIWGQSGLGPHSKNERHYIPSVLPYYKVLDDFANNTISKGESR